MANEQLALVLIRTGKVQVFNKWREEHPETIILNGIDLSGISLSEADLSDVELREANLVEAYLSRANLRRANFRGANLSRATLYESHLIGADLSEANLSEAQIWGADLRATNLSGADLRKANLRGADFFEANLSGADLRGADLSYSNLVKADITNAKISKSNVYGVNVWDLEGEFQEQRDLIITPPGESSISVDNIKIAQFVYLILNNKEIRVVLDTITTKAVLILGRFYDERKQVLDALKDALRERGFVPILFDFEPSKQRDLTETIQLLANMSKFVIADITDAKSIPQELSHIIPLLPSVPVQPILLSSEREYAMFEHWRSFKTVLPEFIYQDKQDLVDNLETKILQPINAWRKDQDEISVLKERIKELEAKKS